MKNMKKKYLSTSILTGLIVASTSLGYMDVANAKTYDGVSDAGGLTFEVMASTLKDDVELTDNISHQINPDPDSEADNDGLLIKNNSNMLFNGDLNASENAGSGIAVVGSSKTIFDGRVTASKNALGIEFGKESTAIFEKSVTAENNSEAGIAVVEGSKAEFKGDIIANKAQMVGTCDFGNVG